MRCWFLLRSGRSREMQGMPSWQVRERCAHDCGWEPRLEDPLFWQQAQHLCARRPDKGNTQELIWRQAGCHLLPQPHCQLWKPPWVQVKHHIQGGQGALCKEWDGSVLCVTDRGGCWPWLWMQLRCLACVDQGRLWQLWLRKLPPWQVLDW